MKIKIFVAIYTLFMLPLLTGCQPPVRGTATYFYGDAPPVEGTSVVVISQTNQASSLEWDVYKGQVESQLASAGFVVLDNKSVADLVCTLFYSIDANGETRTRAVQQYDNKGRAIGVSNYTSQVHQRVLIIRFFNNESEAQAELKPVVEIRVVSEGSSADIATVMPALAKIAFSRWPGKSGKSYSVTVSM